jgi:Co/Zn/Cd efflux system component
MDAERETDSAAAPSKPIAYRRALIIAAVLNLLMVFIEVAAAFYANSIALFADAIDFYEDAMTYFLAVALIGLGVGARALFGGLLALMMAVPCLWIAWKSMQQLLFGLPPDPLPMGATGLLALAVNVYCAYILLPHRKGDSAHQGVWLSTRNDAISNIAIILAAVATAFTRSVWPDAVVGLGIAALNLQAAILISILAWREWSDRQPPAAT